MFFKIIITLILGCLLGCIPGVAIAGRIAGRKLENATTTTVLRECGIKYALIALGIDVCKGFLAALLGSLILGGDSAQLGVAIGGLAVMLGHTYNAFFGFKGTRGIAPYGGILIMMSWWLGILLLLVGVICFACIKFYRPLVLIAALLAAILVSVFVRGTGCAYSIIFSWLFVGFSILLQKDLFIKLFTGRPGPSSSGSGRRILR